MSAFSGSPRYPRAVMETVSSSYEEPGADATACFQRRWPAIDLADVRGIYCGAPWDRSSEYVALRYGGIR
jgi:hypothetical protein